MGDVGRDILREVRERLAKMAACERHRFVRDPRTPTERALQRVSTAHFFNCINCGLGFDPAAVVQYCAGYVAAGGNEEDVMPGAHKPVEQR